MPSAVLGGVVRSSSALNCWPCSRSCTQLAGRLEVLAGHGARQLADDGDQAALALDLDAQHREAVLRIVKGDALDDAGEGFGHGDSIGG